MAKFSFYLSNLLVESLFNKIPMSVDRFLKKLLVLVILLSLRIGVTPAISQDLVIDSLKSEVKTLPDDKPKITALIRLAIIYKHKRDTSGVIYAKRALQLSRQLSHDAGMGDAFSQMASFAKLSQDYSRALQFFDSAIHYFRITERKGSWGDVLNQKGILFMERQDFAEARQYFDEALALYEQQKDSVQIANVLLNIGIVLVDQGLYSKALEYYFRCLAIDEKLRYTAGIASDYTSIAMIFARQGDMGSAIGYYQKALEISEKANDETSAAFTLTNMGIAYKDVGNLDEALKILEKALRISERINHVLGQASVLHNIGVVHYEKGDLEKALNYFTSSNETALAIQGDRVRQANDLMMARIFLKQKFNDKALTKALNARRIAMKNGMPDEEYEATQLLSEIYEKNDLPEQALGMMKQSIRLKDSLFNLEKARQIAELQTQYETNQKENKIELLSKERALQESELKRRSLLQNVTWGGTGFLILIGFIGFRAYRLRQEQKRVLLDQQLKNEKREAERLQELDEAKSRFFANIAHEFRTPLTLILGPTEQILEENSTEKSKENAYLIYQNADKLLSLTNQLLDLSKLESGMIKLHASRRDFIGFAKGCVHSFESLAEERDITIHFHSAVENMEMDFDAEKFAIILNNLLSNALKFTGPFGEVGIAVTVHEEAGEGSRIRVEVSDTGMGIPEEKIPYIFDRFYQVDDSYTRKTQGTGIGLALAKELVELHGGVISVASKIGEGTCFTLTLPQKQKITTDASDIISEEDKREWFENVVDRKVLSPDASAIERERTEAPVVLVVEDNREVRRFIVDILINFYVVIEAENGKKGLEASIEQVPDLIVSDVMMPEMNGYEFCRAVKEDERTSHIPVIMLTAKAGIDSKLEGLSTGVDDYLAKPFNARELLARIKNLITIRQKLHQKYGNTRDTSLFAKKEHIFLVRMKAAIEENIDREEFSVEDLGKALAMSRTQVHRKLKALTNQSTSQFVRQFKLEKALELLKTREFNVSEVAYKVGFNSATYFSTCFTEQFGYPPSELIGIKG
jgi:signal transduction histidine kinase/DNA-binding response OmpR family regulator/Tfp pilus assembly protein PilF